MSFDFFNDDGINAFFRYLRIPANGTKVKLHNYEGDEYEKVVHDATALAKTGDMFCFCAFTSLRYSDMAALKRTDISGDYIYVTTRKPMTASPSISIHSRKRFLTSIKIADSPAERLFR